MDMVIHQAIGPDLQSKCFAAFSQQAKICLSILIVKKDRCAVIPALGDMMWISASDDAFDSGHKERILGRGRKAIHQIGGTPLIFPGQETQPDLCYYKYLTITIYYVLLKEHSRRLRRKTCEVLMS